ncbi:MAG TPA: Gfo/Idh/MocA family oxidoreductase [Acidimicrobiia bacterium]|jgi:scyllo-inositol 2-dehydrogenase (NAD+)|nr:Gfo/Idh/MocA family oxidoreductase [Acidimicrobiia bacterium]
MNAQRIREPIEVGIIGTGWCGGIRAVAAAGSPMVSRLHLAEIRKERLDEVAALTGAERVTTSWEELVEDPSIVALMISATPETTHHPMAKAALSAGKHVLLEKPIAMTLDEADELIELSERGDLKFTVGYSQRFNTKQAYVKKSVEDGVIGDPVTVLVSRHITRSLGAKIGSRTKLSPAAMEATHDIDFALWALQPRTPVRVYSQVAYGVRQAEHGVPDHQIIVVTMDDGVTVTIGAGWSLPPGYPNYSSTWIEFLGTEGALMMDATHKDIVMHTMSDGTRFPLSTMPGEYVDHVYAGPMERETLHFIEAVYRDGPVMVAPRLARQAMEVYVAADLSVEKDQAIDLPLR